MVAHANCCHQIVSIKNLFAFKLASVTHNHVRYLTRKRYVTKRNLEKVGHTVNAANKVYWRVLSDINKDSYEILSYKILQRDL